LPQLTHDPFLAYSLLGSCVALPAFLCGRTRCKLTFENQTLPEARGGNPSAHFESCFEAIRRLVEFGLTKGEGRKVVPRLKFAMADAVDNRVAQVRQNFALRAQRGEVEGLVTARLLGTHADGTALCIFLATQAVANIQVLPALCLGRKPTCGRNRCIV
jgi:hypothetical protein